MHEVWKSLNSGSLIKLGDMKAAASELLKATDKRVWLFDGEMGSGKTTLVKALCEQLGVKEVMSSPTFSIVNEYNTDDHKVIYHFDFYRLKNETEALDIGVEEYLDSGNYCFLEWPDKIPNLLPTDCFSVRIRLSTPIDRIIEYSA